ncbi:MAG: PH domain-containing protein [Bacilli bacterium]|nr:PH domain-containing protein [Bacilli bacterium]
MKEKMKLLMKDYETILYEGKPNTLCSVLEIIFNPLLPISIIWGFIDSLFIKTILNNNFYDDTTAIFLVIFFAVHLMPVWMYIFGILSGIYKYIKTYYIVTNETAYISNGDSKKGIITIPFKEMAIVETHEGLFDKMLGVGDVEISSKKSNVNELEKVSISSISNFNELCNYISTQKTEESSDSPFEW